MAVTVHNPGTLPLSDSTWPEGPDNYAQGPNYDYWIVQGGAGNNPPDPSWSCAVADLPHTVESRRDGSKKLDELVYTHSGGDTPLPTIVQQATSGRVTGTTVTVPITASGIGRTLLVLVAIWDDSINVSSITAGAENFTAVPSALAHTFSRVTATGCTGDAWVLGPTAASHTSVIVNISSSGDFAVRVYELNHVNPALIVGANTNSNAFGAALDWGATASPNPAMAGVGMALCLEVQVSENPAYNITPVNSQESPGDLTLVDPNTRSIAYNWNTDQDLHSNSISGAAQWVSICSYNEGSSIFPEYLNITSPVNACFSGVAIGGIPQQINFTLAQGSFPSSLVLSLGAPIYDENDVSFQAGIAIGYENSAQVLPQINNWTVISGVLHGTMNSNPTDFVIGRHYLVGQSVYNPGTGNIPSGFAFAEVIYATRGVGFFPPVTFTFVGAPPPDQTVASGLMYFVPVTGKITGATPGKLPGQYPPMYDMEELSSITFATGSMSLGGYWIDGQKIYATYAGFDQSWLSAYDQPWQNITALQTGGGPATLNLKTLRYNALYGLALNDTSDWLVCRNFGFNSSHIPVGSTIRKVMFIWEGSGQVAITPSSDTAMLGVNNLATLLANNIIRVPFTQQNGDLGLGYYGDPGQVNRVDISYGNEDDYWQDAGLRIGGISPQATWPGSTINDGSSEFCCSETWNQDYFGDDNNAVLALGFSSKGRSTPSRLEPADIYNSGFGFAVCAYNGNYSARGFADDDGQKLVQLAHGHGSATFAAPTQPGNTVIVVQGLLDGSVLSLPTDDQASTYVVNAASVASPNNNSANGSVGIWHAKNVSGVNTVTGHSGATVPEVWIYEVKTYQSPITVSPSDISGKTFGAAAASSLAQTGGGLWPSAFGTDIGVVGTNSTNPSAGHDFCLAVCITTNSTGCSGCGGPWSFDTIQNKIGVAYGFFKNGDHPIPYFKQGSGSGDTPGDWGVGQCYFTSDLDDSNQAAVEVRSARMAVFFTPPSLGDGTGTPSGLPLLIAEDPLIGSGDGHVMVMDGLTLTIEEHSPAGLGESGCGQGPVISIDTSPIPNGTIGVPYPTFAFTIDFGGTPNFLWTVDGQLPPGLILSPDGVLSGTPITAGTYTFTVKVTDMI